MSVGNDICVTCDFASHIGLDIYTFQMKIYFDKQTDCRSWVV